MLPRMLRLSLERWFRHPQHYSRGPLMSTAVETVVQPMDLRALHDRMGRVNHQPVRVHSFTNKRFTVNFRVPLDQLRRVVPPALQLDEIGDSHLGMLSMCACDFWVSR